MRNGVAPGLALADDERPVVLGVLGVFPDGGAMAGRGAGYGIDLWAAVPHLGRGSRRLARQPRRTSPDK